MTNEAAIGYALHVLKKDWNFNKKNLEMFSNDMKLMMDRIDEDKAEKTYKSN